MMEGTLGNGRGSVKGQKGAYMIEVYNIIQNLSSSFEVILGLQRVSQVATWLTYTFSNASSNANTLATVAQAANTDLKL